LSELALLSKRELRGLRLAERFPWILPAAVSALWAVVFFGAWLRVAALLDHGAPHGVTSLSQLNALLEITPGATYNAFQVFAITTMNQVFSDFYMAFVMSVFAAVIHFQNRLALRLWRSRK
jgi:hypothetical protein